MNLIHNELVFPLDGARKMCHWSGSVRVKFVNEGKFNLKTKSQTLKFPNGQQFSLYGKVGWAYNRLLC